MLMNKIIQTPFWLFELLTSAKSFKDNPFLGSQLLNKLGLHVVRLVASNLIMRGRMWLLALPVSSQDRQNYFNNGFIIKEDFLSDEAFSLLEKEAKAFQGQFREARQGDTLTHRAALSPDVLRCYPELDKLLSSSRLKRLTQFTAGHFRAPLFYLELVKNKYCEGSEDPQKTLHHDTFHPSMKCWLFFDDVDEDAGPFVYVPKSHKLTWKRIKWEYQMSIKARDATNTLHARGSTRFTKEDLEELGLAKPRAFTVKKNTLVIANVFGIHRRGDSHDKSTRLALWGDSRTNPFIPFPGIGGKTSNRIQHYFLEMYRNKADESALKKRGRSPWKVLDKNSE